MKTILITGASSGIGRALAVQAARAGYGVFAVGRSLRALAALAGQVGEEGGTIATDVTDISEPANAPGLIGRAVGAYGHIDVLVNNAGAAAVGPIAMQTDEAMRIQFGTHVLGPLALTREALPTLRASRGHVFMLGSGVARVPVGGMGAYPPSKAALRSATSILRRELVPLDVAVTYVDPGAVDTGFMTRAGMPGASRDVLVSPELVARKILLAIVTRPRVLNVTPLQTAAVALAEVFPGIAEAVLERNPSLIGAGPSIAAIEMQRDNNGRGEKIALPSTRLLPLLPEIAPEPAEAVLPPTPPTRWKYEPPETVPDDEVAERAAQGSTAHHNVEPPMPTSSFDAALESLQRRMERAKLSTDFVKSLLVVDNVIDVGEAAMRWAGMPNKHERSLTTEVLFALAEWGFLAPRADGRYRVLHAANDTPVTKTF
ncbi:MAG TPA: SDR family NAD(P)-dependent oxidoreductase [Candidatus Lustribacter sp.]